MKRNHSNPNILKAFASSSVQALKRTSSTGNIAIQALKRSSSTGTIASRRSLEMIKNVSQQMIRKSIRNNFQTQKTNDSDTVFDDAELHTSKPEVFVNSSNPSKNGKGQEQNQEEHSMMDELEHQLKEIERKKQMDLQNIKDWTMEKKWKLEQKQFQNRKQEVELSRKAIDAFVANEQNSVIEQLVVQNELLRHEFSIFQKEKESFLAVNVQLRDEYKHCDELLESMNQMIADKRQKKETLMAFDKQTRMLIKECTLQQQAYVSNAKAKQVFHQTIENIIQLLGNECTDMQLLFDIIAIADKPEDKGSNPVSSSPSYREEMENCNDDKESCDVDNNSNKSVRATKRTDSITSLADGATSLALESNPLSDHIIDTKGETNNLQPSNEYIMNSWDDTNHTYTSVLEDVTSSSFYDFEEYVASVNPIIEIEQDMGAYDIVETPSEKLNREAQAQRANDDEDNGLGKAAMRDISPAPQHYNRFWTEGLTFFEEDIDQSYTDQSSTAYSEDFEDFTETSNCSFIASINPIVRRNPSLNAKNTVYASTA